MNCFRVKGALIVLAAALLALGTVEVLEAQSTGGVKGKVVDVAGKPVDGAKVSIDFQEGVKRHFEVTTNKRGEFLQIGLPPGQYNVTVEKEKLGSQTKPVRIRLGDPAEMEFKLAPGQAGTGPSKEDIAKIEQMKKTFTEGVEASRAGNHDEAILKFTAVTEMAPTCNDCYYNIGFSHAQKKEYDKAEAAYQKAIEIKPTAEAYSSLANIYNAQKKFDEAAVASAEASKLAETLAGTAGSANPDFLYQQAVILWNANKIPEAKEQLDQVIKLKPDYADAHFMMGRTLLNLGKLAEAATAFDTYLKLAPTGTHAAEAKQNLTLLNQMKK